MRTLAALSVSLLFAACQAPPPEMTEGESAQIQAEVMAFAESRARAFSEVNADRLMEDWLDHDITEVSFAERLVGREATASFYQDLVSRWGSAEQRWTPGSTVDVISPTVALFQGTATFASTNPEGVANRLQKLHVTQLLRKVGGVWKIQREHVSGGVVAEN